MKRFFPLLFVAACILSVTSYGQMRLATAGTASGSFTQTRTTGNLPAGYYNAANGLTCGNLKTALSGIISSGTTVISYDGLYTAYRKTDTKRNDNNTADVVWDMYSDNPTGTDPYTYTHGVKQCGNYSQEGDCYNREHSFPQSWFNEQSPMVSDIFHVYPTDGKVNNMRGSFPFGEATSVSSTSRNGSKVGTGTTANFGYSGTVFEPINEYKGDFARTMFYMVTRYDSQVSGWQNNGTANTVLSGNRYPALDDWFLKLMYKWHLQDPVSQKEINRNDSAFLLQGNRNPFIDRPDFVYAIWSCTGLLTATSVNDNLNLPGRAVVLYPNPVTTATVSIQLEKAFTQTSTLQVMDINGRIIRHKILPAGQLQASVQVDAFSPGIYYLKLSNKEGFVTRTFVVQ
jgi:endonuclease I